MWLFISTFDKNLTKDVGELDQVIDLNHFLQSDIG